jgi:hypothetical protein
MQVTNKVLAAATFLVASALIPGLSFAADAGRVTSALGEASLLRGTGKIQMTTGATVQSGDEIQTGYPAQVLVDMADGSKLALPHDTTFKVDKFAQSSSGGSAIFTLIKGAFRTVSGLIGKGSADNYQMNTPVATMGIRGTDYSAVFKADGGKLNPDGLYAKVAKGIINVKNAAGSIDVAAGQTVYVKDSNTKPKLIDNADSVFKAAGLNAGNNFASVFTGFDIKLDGNSLNLRINPIIDPKLPNNPSTTVPPVTIPTPQVPASPS